MSVRDQTPMITIPELPDVDIRRVAALPEHLAGAVPVNGFVEATPDRLLVRMPGIGRFLAEEGRRLLIAGEAEVSDADLDYFAVRTPLAGLIHQRGELPLHAACLLPPGGKAAVAISGVSGAGKSTLAAMLLGRGWRFVADEVVRVTLDAEGRPLAWPGTPVVALWPDAARMLGITLTDLPMARPQHGRVLHQAIPMSGPVALGHVVLLDLHRKWGYGQAERGRPAGNPGRRGLPPPAGAGDGPSGGAYGDDDTACGTAAGVAPGRCAQTFARRTL